VPQRLSRERWSVPPNRADHAACTGLAEDRSLSERVQDFGRLLPRVRRGEARDPKNRLLSQRLSRKRRILPVFEVKEFTLSNYRECAPHNECGPGSLSNPVPCWS
jgi:hypothetical protein